MHRQHLVTDRSDLVGFLPIEREFRFSGGSFTPVADFQESLAAVQKRTNTDHFLYPPTETRQTTEFIDRKTGKLVPEEEREQRELPGTERPALLHHLPPSHLISLDSPSIKGPLRESDGAFLMHLLGYLFGHRMQFYDWWFDGRVRMKSAHHTMVRRENETPFISTSYEAWRAWPTSSRKRFTNALYVLSRAPTYEWDWERFLIYYTVFDALYRVANETASVTAKSHAERLPTMCSTFGLYQNADHFAAIVDLRNNLFHETLWSGSQPCSTIRERHWRQVNNLRRLNERLVPALLGFRTDYIANPWDHISMAVF